MHWMISQNGVCPGTLSCWTIQLNMIMLSTLTLLNTQVNEQFTVKCRNIWSHLHAYKQYLFLYEYFSEWYMLEKNYQEMRIYSGLKRYQRNYILYLFSDIVSWQKEKYKVKPFSPTSIKWFKFTKHCTQLILYEVRHHISQPFLKRHFPYNIWLVLFH